MIRFRREFFSLKIISLWRRINITEWKYEFATSREGKTGQERDNLLVLGQSIRKDLKNNYFNYPKIISSFRTLIEGQVLESKHEQLIDILFLLSHYPKIHLSNNHLLALYKRITHNSHLQTVQELNKSLLFVLKADPHISQSPIYHTFIKFYVQVPMEEWRVKYQIDFQNVSVLEALKQFLARATQRGFFSRTPAYTRNLNLKYPERVLSLLGLARGTENDLIVRKAFYGLFLNLKQFYQGKMGQNVYHPSKVQLMQMMSGDFMRVISRQLPLLNHESTHLRELYMKLYLSIPEDPQQLCYFNLTQQQLTSFGFNIGKLKYQSVVYLYQLAISHIERMDHLSLSQIKENMEIIIEFVQKVQANFKKLAQEKLSVSFSLHESFRVLHLFTKLHLQASQTYKDILERIVPQISSLNFSVHFEEIILLMKQTVSRDYLIGIAASSSQLQFLSLKELTQLAVLIEGQKAQNSNFQAVLYGSVVKRLLQTDFTVIGGQELIQMTQIYSKYHILRQLGNETADCADSLRVFIMRYMSDHHTQFSLSQFEQLLHLFLKLPQSACANFDDEEGNYSKGLFEEMQEYCRKVRVVLGNQVQEGLRSRG